MFAALLHTVDVVLQSVQESWRLVKFCYAKFISAFEISDTSKTC
jgi:hypothetical protein